MNVGAPRLARVEAVDAAALGEIQTEIVGALTEGRDLRHINGGDAAARSR